MKPGLPTSNWDTRFFIKLSYLNNKYLIYFESNIAKVFVNVFLTIPFLRTRLKYEAVIMTFLHRATRIVANRFRGRKLMSKFKYGLQK